MADQEVGRLVALAAARAGVESDVGDQAVLGRDAGEHRGVDALGAGAPDRLVRRQHEDAGMAVHRDAHAPPRARRREHPLDHLLVRVAARLAGRVRVVERLGVGLQLAQPAFGGGVLDDEEELVRRFDRGERLGRHLSRDAEARADQQQLTSGSSHLRFSRIGRGARRSAARW